MEPEATDGKPWLEQRLKVLEALYVRYGRDGLKDQSLTDVGMLLASKELALRDMPKGRDITESQKAANRQLELEVKDLTGYINGLLAAASLPLSRALRSLAAPPQQQQEFKPKARGYEMER